MLVIDRDGDHMAQSQEIATGSSFSIIDPSIGLEVTIHKVTVRFLALSGIRVREITDG
jgi:hypothetical protein